VREIEIAKGLELEPGVSTEGLENVYARLAIRSNHPNCALCSNVWPEYQIPATSPAR